MSSPSAARWAPDPSLPGYVTDGGLETDLIFHHGIDLPEFAAFPLLDDAAGRDLLTSYYEAYAGIAAGAGAGLILETPTWRANTEWGARIGVDAAGLARVNAAAVQFMSDLSDRFTGDVPEVVVAGMVGPRGDGYVAGEVMHPEQARDYHLPQVRAFADAGASLVTALTLTTAEEAVGIVLAAREVGLPVTVAFTVETDGRLPDGSTLREAVERVDAAAAPDHFVVNCAHPTHVAEGLADAGPWLGRIVGTRVNASTRSHEELDAAEELDEGDPDTLGRDQADLAALLPGLQVVGGCCGTDARHVAAMWGVPLEVPRG
jgi:homocysteine S-methyltransferase